MKYIIKIEKQQEKELNSNNINEQVMGLRQGFNEILFKAEMNPDQAIEILKHLYELNESNIYEKIEGR